MNGTVPRYHENAHKINIRKKKKKTKKKGTKKEFPAFSTPAWRCTLNWPTSFHRCNYIDVMHIRTVTCIKSLIELESEYKKRLGKRPRALCPPPPPCVVLFSTFFSSFSFFFLSFYLFFSRRQKVINTISVAMRI